MDFIGGASSVTGSGAANRLAYWTSATALSSDAGFTVDAANDRLILTGTGASGRLRIAYDGSNYSDWYTDSAGELNATFTGTAPSADLTASYNGTFLSQWTNTNVGASAAAAYLIGTPSTGGDAYIRFNISGGDRWAFGIDNSDSDSLKVVNGADPSIAAATMTWNTSGVLIPSLTATRIVYVGAAGLLSDDADFTFTAADNSVYVGGYLNVSNGSAAAIGDFGAGDTNTFNWDESACLVDVVRGGAGDPFLRFALTTTASYAIGIDDSDSDKFKISYAASGTAVLGTGDYFSIATTGATTVNQWLNVGTTTIAGAANQFGAGTTSNYLALIPAANNGLYLTTAENSYFIITSGSSGTDSLIGYQQTGVSTIMYAGCGSATFGSGASYMIGAYTGSVFPKPDGDLSDRGDGFQPGRGRCRLPHRRRHRS